MRFIVYYIVFSIILTVSFTGNASGQMLSVNADTAVVTDLPTDSIFVFYSQNTGTLKVRYKGPGSPKFQWGKFNPSSNSYDNLDSYNDSVATNLASGGYRVHVTETSSTYDTIFRGWVYIDTLTVKLEKDNNGNLKYNRYTCDYTDIKASSTHSNFIYYDSHGVKQTLAEPKYRWWSDPPIPIYSTDNTNWLRIDTSRMPLEKAQFYVEAKDRFGHVSNTDVVNYSPIITKAIMDTTGTGSHPVVDRENSAPFTAYIANKSKNAVKYTWFNAKIDSFTTNTMDKDSVTFKATGTFKVRLVSQSLELCTDTASMDIIVAKGKIGSGKDTSSLPNVFVPGSQFNSYFKIHNVSIRQFRFTVYSRWGKPVYKKEGPSMLDWPGWKGNINTTGGESGPDASDGVYFYVLEVISYDKVPDPKRMNPKGQYSGFLYLFRQK